MNPVFLSDKAEEGFQTLLADLQKLRLKNRELIPAKQLKLLDRTMHLVTVVGTVILSVAIIYMVWTILSSHGMDTITKMIQWAIDLLKLAKVMV